MKFFYEIRDGGIFVGESYTQPFPPHVHHIVELVYMLNGHAQIMIGQKIWNLQKGDTIIAFPNIPHAYEGFSDDARGLSMFFMPDTISEFSGVLSGMRPQTPVLTAAEAGPELPLIAQKLQDISQSKDHSFLLAYMHLFLAHLLTSLTMTPLCGSNGLNQVDRVIRYISENYQTAITLKSAAAALNISVSHLSHIFTQQLNISFRQYINALRIDLAKQLLCDRKSSITSICFRCGYENMRTFNRVFRTECGVTPSAYSAAYLRAAEASGSQRTLPFGIPQGD